MPSTRSKALLAGVVVAVGVGWRWNRRRRRVLRLVTFQFRFDPLGYIGDLVGGAFSSVASNIKGYVLGIVGMVGDLLLDGIYRVFDLATGAYHFGENVLSTALDHANALYQAARNAIGAAVDTVSHYAEAIGHQAITWADELYQRALGVLSSAIGSVRDFATGIVNTARDFAVSLYHSALDAIANAGGALRDFATAAAHAVGDALHGVLFAALDAVRGLVDEVWSFVYDTVLPDLAGIKDFLADRVDNLIDIVEAVADWLVWLAQFAFSGVADAVGFLRQLDSDNVIAIVRSEHARHTAAPGGIRAGGAGW